MSMWADAQLDSIYQQNREKCGFFQRVRGGTPGKIQLKSTGQVSDLYFTDLNTVVADFVGGKILCRLFANSVPFIDWVDLNGAQRRMRGSEYGLILEEDD